MLVTLSFEQIYQRCDLAELDFADTAELNQLTRPLGQERALDAIEFGVDIQHSGFNVFALGPPGVGKHELVNSILAIGDETQLIKAHLAVAQKANAWRRIQSGLSKFGLDPTGRAGLVVNPPKSGNSFDDEPVKAGKRKLIQGT